MEANGEASKAPSCSKPRIFKAPQGHTAWDRPPPLSVL